ncbi:MAG TPA: beta-ketoacyl synthase N-terminal-like domain-containing protein [Chitinophagales bacterium]|nr:beta-ketoacyl synthase N-terminal-like domain-containing protein [Chitinophagales bacterium]
MENIEIYKQQLEEAYKQLAETQRALQKVQAEKNEPIAIIGMAMRLPGKIKNANDLWKVLLMGLIALKKFLPTVGTRMLFLIATQIL